MRKSKERKARKRFLSHGVRRKQPRVRLFCKMVNYIFSLCHHSSITLLRFRFRMLIFERVKMRSLWWQTRIFMISERVSLSWVEAERKRA